MMTHIDTGITGAKRQSWKHDNPRDLLKTIIEKNPQASKEVLLKKFSETIFQKHNFKLLETMVEYWFANNLHSLLNSNIDLKKGFSNPLKKKFKQQIREHIQLAAETILLDMIMPNGKKLRDCSGTECAAIGSWLSIVASRMPPNALVGKIFNERKLREILEEGASA
jgi:hypothetical protein